MAHNLTLALQITVIGMGLVFGSILLFWLLMAVLVRLTAGRSQALAEAAPPAAPGERRRKRQAAAAGVAAALALQNAAEPTGFPLPPTALVSAWQAVTRASSLRQRGPVRRGQ